MLKTAFKRILMIETCGIIVFMLYFSINYSKTRRKCDGSMLDCKFNDNSTRTFVGVNNYISKNENNSAFINIHEVFSDICSKINITQNISDVESSWSSVDNTRRVFVYSAYHVQNKIVVIAAKTSVVKRVFCQLWYQRNNTDGFFLSQISATATTLPESHGYRYASSFIDCPIDSDKVPEYVSIVTEKCQDPKHFLRVQSAVKPHNHERKFTVCLPPLNLNYSKAYEFVEWVELNRILGAEKFLIYKHCVAKNIEQVLDYYTKQGLVDVLSWNLPMSTRYFHGDKRVHEIHYFGQVAALNDCLYRNKKSSKFVVNVDLDEFIVPHSKHMQTWSDIVNNSKPSENVYLFRNTFFKKDWESSKALFDADDTKFIEKYNIVTLQKIKHERKVFSPKMRSKYFARTSEVGRLMIHDVPAAKIGTVDTNVGLLHHYRFWGGVNDSESMKVYDDTIPVKYGKQLLANIAKVWSQLTNVNLGTD
ncbi:hypothetical protein ACF0H5_006358 [Mactra antiquata]